MSSTDWEPQEIDDATVAFPGSVSHLMPKWADIPDEFRKWNRHNRWQRFFSDMFYSGLKDVKLTPKEGIDSAKAMRHIDVIARSFEPKHEHKEAAVAYLMSLWFDDVTYTRAEAK